MLCSAVEAKQRESVGSRKAKAPARYVLMTLTLLNLKLEGYRAIVEAHRAVTV